MSLPASVPPAAPPPRARSGTGGLPILVGRLLFGVLCVVLLLCWLAWDELGSPFGPGMAGLAAYLLFAVHVVLLRKRISPFDPVVWVPVSMLMFYFGLSVAVEIFDWPLGYDAWQIGVPPNLERGFCALLFAFVAFLWGIYLAGVGDCSRPLPPDAARDQDLVVPALIQSIGGVTMIAFGVVLVGPSVVFGYYDEWWAAKGAGADPRFIDMGICFTIGGVYALLAADDPRYRWRRWLAYAVAALIAFITINKGDRTGLISLSIGSGWCYSQRIRRVPVAIVAAMAAFALLLMPVLHEFREWKSVEGSRGTPITELAANAFAGFGGSALVMPFTEELVPKQRGYAWGVTYLDALLNLVPNFSLTPGRTWTFDPYKYSPSILLTRAVNPGYLELGSGYGFSMAAEWHWNFGPIGVLLGMAFFGWILTRTRNASPHSALMLAWSALLFAGLTIHVRNTFGHPLKFAVWPAVGLWVLSRLARAMRGPRAALGEDAAPGLDAARRRSADLRT